MSAMLACAEVSALTFEPPTSDAPAGVTGLDRIARREGFARWSTRCLVASWAVACLLVAVAAVSLRWPFIVVLVVLVALALGSPLLAVAALVAQRTSEGWWLLGIAVVSLGLVPGAAYVLSLIVSIVLHGFDLPT